MQAMRKLLITLPFLVISISILAQNEGTTEFKFGGYIKADFLNSWYTGPASRNSDGTVHAIVTFLGNNTWEIAWEDLDFNSPSYDGDYNDLIVTVKGTVIPEPGTLALVGIGLASLTGLVRRRRNRS